MRRLALSIVLLTLLPPSPTRADEPAIDYSKLKNGLELIVVEKHTTPLVTIEIAVKTGSFTETLQNNGLSHLYEHMFFKGNAALPTQQAYMQRVAELGISFNGTTSTERVNYYITLPSRNFAKGMTFMADAILSPLFNMDEMKSERKVVIGEYDRNEANPTHYLWNGLRTRMYGDQAYRKNPLGERKVILSATQKTMRDFRDRFYVPNNACLLIVGDVNPTEAKVLAERLLGPRRWKKGKDPHALPREPLPRLEQTKAFVTTEKTGKSQPLILGLRWPGPDVGRDERATFVADVWGTLCGLPHGRFQKTLRDRGLTNDATLSYFTQREGGEINFMGVVRDGKVFETRDALLAEVGAMAQAGYWTDKELALAKRNLRIGRAYEAQSGANLAHTLSFWWASSSIDYYTRYLKATDSVTLDELRGFVRNYLVGRPLVIGCLANTEAVAKLGLNAKVLAPKIAAGSAVASAVEELKLKNGVRVLFRREPSASVSALSVFVDGGCLDLTAARQGVDKLLLSTLFDGTKGKTRDELTAELVSLGARTSNDTNYDYSRVAIAAPPKGFPQAVALLAECLREPRFEPRAVAQRRSQMLTALGSEKADADSYVVRVLNRVFFAKHPYLLRPDGTPKTVQGLTGDDLRARLKELLVSGRLLLVMVANMDKAAAQKALEAGFSFVPEGKWARKAAPAFTPSGLVDRDARKIPLTYLLGKCAAPAEGHPDYPATRLALAVLRKRMWNTLRTKYALTYASAAGISRYRANYGYVYVSTREPARAVQLIHADIRRLQRELVAPTELKGLITQTETRLYTRSESASSHSEGLGHAELTGGSWRSYYQTPLALGRVTPQDVRRVARAYLKKFSFGLIGPHTVRASVLRGGGPTK